MELPILYALTHPERVPDDGLPHFDPIAASPLTFEALRRDDFPAFRLGIEAGKAKGTAPAAFNAANEMAVQMFLEGRMRFGKIAEVIDRVLQRHEVRSATDLETILESDRWAREQGRALCS
jgi:1-deoxy-D-xylulose-5-phosphate reductoisomerase